MIMNRGLKRAENIPVVTGFSDTEKKRQKLQDRLIAVWRDNLLKGVPEESGEYRLKRSPDGTLELCFIESPRVSGRVPREYDPDDPDGILESYVILKEPRHVEEGYVATERVELLDGSVNVMVRPDEHGHNLSKQDLRAALEHDMYLGVRWATQGITPEQAALIAHSFCRKKENWISKAKQSMSAFDPSQSPEEVDKKVMVVIDGLIEMHNKKIQSES
jgi:hypothetical protein